MAGPLPGHSVLAAMDTLLPPRAEGFLESARARRSLLHCEDRTLAAGVDQRNVEPVPLLQQLYIALHVDIDRRETDQEIPVGDFDRETSERDAARLFVLFHQDAGYVVNATFRKIGRQREHDLDRMTRRQRLVGIASERPCHAQLTLRYLNVGADSQLRG